MKKECANMIKTVTGGLMNKNIINLLLDLFDGGAGAGADSSGAGAAGDSNNGETQALSSPAVKRKAENPLKSVQYGKQPQADESTIESKEPTQKSPEERAAEFEKLIKEDYKDIFQQKMQSVIDKRFAETKSLQAAQDKTAPLINKLMERYGVSDIAGLEAAIDKDTSYLEEAAEKAGMPLDQYRSLNALRVQNEQLRQQFREQQRRAEAERVYSGWVNEAETLKTSDPMYASLDLEAEIQNTDFRKMLQAGVSVKAAYDAVHSGDMLKAAYTAAQQQTVQNIQKRNSRPTENGTSNLSGITVKSDVSKLTRADRAEIARRVMRGEKISF